MSSPPLLECRNIDKSFGGILALRAVSLDCTRGEVVAIVGPNGSGKTTLINVISGVISPDAGRVICASHDVTLMSAYHCSRAGIGRTFQNLRLFHSLSVNENLLVGGYVACRRLPRSRRQSLCATQARADELCALLGLVDVRARRAGELAYGLQRRVDVARALMASPQLLLLDEPTAGMNDLEAAEMRAVIHQQRERGLAQVIVDHNVPFLSGVADWMVAMDAGRVITTGHPQDVVSDSRVVDAYFGR